MALGAVQFYIQFPQRAMESQDLDEHPQLLASPPKAARDGCFDLDDLADLASTAVPSPSFGFGSPPQELGQGSLQRHIEWQLSEESLREQLWLRLHMDQDGWICFRDILELCGLQSPSMLVRDATQAARDSSLLEVSEDGRKVRPRDIAIRSRLNLHLAQKQTDGTADETKESSTTVSAPQEKKVGITSYPFTVPRLPMNILLSHGAQDGTAPQRWHRVLHSRAPSPSPPVHRASDVWGQTNQAQQRERASREGRCWRHWRSSPGAMASRRSIRVACQADMPWGTTSSANSAAWLRLSDDGYACAGASLLRW